MCEDVNLDTLWIHPPAKHTQTMFVVTKDAWTKIEHQLQAYARALELCNEDRNGWEASVGLEMACGESPTTPEYWLQQAELEVPCRITHT